MCGERKKLSPPRLQKGPFSFVAPPSPQHSLGRDKRSWGARGCICGYTELTGSGAVRQAPWSRHRSTMDRIHAPPSPRGPRASPGCCTTKTLRRPPQCGAEPSSCCLGQGHRCPSFLSCETPATKPVSLRFLSNNEPGVVSEAPDQTQIPPREVTQLPRPQPPPLSLTASICSVSSRTSARSQQMSSDAEQTAKGAGWEQPGKGSPLENSPGDSE